MSDATGVLGRVRQPEYTGENRCLPCTVVNVAIAASGSLLAGTWLALAVETAVAVAVAEGLFLAALVVIWLRGYLVPGTPTLTKRYLPERALAAFGKAPGDPVVHPGERGGDPDLNVEGRLREAGALEPCRDGDLCLTEDLRAAWHDRIDALGDGDIAGPLARLGVVDPDASVELVERDRSTVAVVDGRRAGMWESDPAARADLAAADLLTDRVPDWADLAPADRVRLTGGLRVFLETCPACEGALTFDTETRESCCTSREVAAVSCDSCGACLFESPVDTDALAA